jgi:hypothetical protein
MKNGRRQPMLMSCLQRRPNVSQLASLDSYCKLILVIFCFTEFIVHSAKCAPVRTPRSRGVHCNIYISISSN